ncbi:Integral membrane protein sed5 [Golovinomyces cichoracearum]|uniref:Integral membrane protein sed5 n=1 Tax=Golovinomyces cichoracearum TaxID=62708 RepID=A0A420HPA0_9PEZI|nr:Integral membrane protein sed5 [Golovinomyces cichoracearum]
MTLSSIQDRTNEFKSVLTQVQKRQATSKIGTQRQSLLSNAQKASANAGFDGNGKAKRSEFARKAAEIGRGIAATMGKLEKLAQCMATSFVQTVAKRKTLFDDRPVEINELTSIIKQDLSSLNQQISFLHTISRSQHPKADQEGEHNKNVVFLLQGKLTNVSANFKDVLEVRTKNIQASRARTENFVSSISAHVTPPPIQSSSPLYNNATKNSNGVVQDLLSLSPVGDQQLLMMEEAQPSNTYIQQRGEAIEAIERTIGELGGIFGQLATMVSEQNEMIQRIDANTEDVVDNVQGAQRELLKYWSRVSGNRWLVAKMMGVLMIFFLQVLPFTFVTQLTDNFVEYGYFWLGNNRSS